MQKEQHSKRRNAATGSTATDGPGECADVLVIGAGPAGLAAALDAKAEGAERVVILDRLPGYSRCRSVIIDFEVLTLLEEWGVTLDSVNQVETFTYVHGYGNTQQTEHMPFPRLGPPALGRQRRVEPRPNDILLRRLPRAVQQIKDLEQVILTAARKQGIEVFFDALVSTPPEIMSDSVHLNYELAGEARSIACSYLVVADGARSPVSQLLGNVRIPSDTRSYQYTCTVFESARRDVLLFWVPRHASGINEMTGLGNGSRYTLVSRLPREFESAESADLVNTRLPGMIEQAAASIGISGRLTDGPMRFSTDMDRLQEVAIHPRVLCVGDAARKGDPGFGGNMNEAIRDGRRFGAYFGAVSRDPGNSGAALRRFRNQVQGATNALQTGGVLTNNMRAFFSIGDAAQSILPGPVRSLLHFDVGLLMKATGAMVSILNSSSSAKRNKP